MNIIEELQSLDTSDPGRWPLLFRLVSVVVVFVAVASATQGRSKPKHAALDYTPTDEELVSGAH